MVVVATDVVVDSSSLVVVEAPVVELGVVDEVVVDEVEGEAPLQAPTNATATATSTARMNQSSRPPLECRLGFTPYPSHSASVVNLSPYAARPGG